MVDLAHIEFAPEPHVARVACFGGARGVRRLDFGMGGTGVRESGSGGEVEGVTWDLLVSLFEHFSLDVRSYREGALERRLPALRRRLRVNSLAVARVALEGSGELRNAALESLLLGVTDFFRDEGVFEFLRVEGLPGLLAGGGGVRVLSAGCSDGRELYSVGMLLGEAGRLEGSRLLGIDCRPEAIAQARRGIYEGEAVERVGAGLCDRWFERVGNGYRVRRELAGVARFEVGNVLGEERREKEEGRMAGRPAMTLAPPPGEAGVGEWDLILCRNVIMYFTAGAAEGAWRRLGELLRPGGLLVTGKAERPPAGLGLVKVSGCVYGKAGNGGMRQR